MYNQKVIDNMIGFMAWANYPTMNETKEREGYIKALKFSLESKEEDRADMETFFENKFEQIQLGITTSAVHTDLMEKLINAQRYYILNRIDIDEGMGGTKNIQETWKDIKTAERDLEEFLSSMKKVEHEQC